jgi:hypothetical protein
MTWEWAFIAALCGFIAGYICGDLDSRQPDR